GAITVDARGAGGSGGNSASAGGRFVARGATKSITFRLVTNETMRTASAIEIVFRCIVPPGSQMSRPARFYREEEGHATAQSGCIGACTHEYPDRMSASRGYSDNICSV